MSMTDDNIPFLTMQDVRRISLHPVNRIAEKNGKILWSRDLYIKTDFGTICLSLSSDEEFYLDVH